MNSNISKKHMKAWDGQSTVSSIAQMIHLEIVQWLAWCSVLLAIEFISRSCHVHQQSMDEIFFFVCWQLIHNFYFLRGFFSPNTQNRSLDFQHDSSIFVLSVSCFFPFGKSCHYDPLYTLWSPQLRTWISGLAQGLQRRGAEALVQQAEKWYFRSVEELLADPKARRVAHEGPKNMDIVKNKGNLIMACRMSEWMILNEWFWIILNEWMNTHIQINE